MAIDDVLGHVLESSQLRGPGILANPAVRAPWGLRFAARDDAGVPSGDRWERVLLVGGARYDLGRATWC